MGIVELLDAVATPDYYDEIRLQHLHKKRRLATADVV